MGRENWMGVSKKLRLWRKMHSGPYDIRFVRMIPDWCQVPFNLTGVHERNVTDRQIPNATISHSLRNDYSHHLRESRLSSSRIRTLRSFHSTFLLPPLLPRNRLSGFLAARLPAFSQRTQEFSKDSICACSAERRI